MVNRPPTIKRNEELIMTELVTVENNQVVASSRVVAENFGKRHDNVVRDIENLKISLLKSEELFYKTTYTSRGKEYPMYLINKKGFMLLVMGFNGAKALETKMRFLDRFEQMEAELRDLKMQLNVPSYQIENPIERAKVWIGEEEKRQQLQLEVKEKEELLIEQAPKVEALDVLTGDTNKLHTIKDIANNYSMSAIKFNELLHKLGVQYKQSGVWKLYAKYQGKGYTATPTGISPQGHTYKNMKWTNKGEYFLYNFLKERGYTSTVYEEMFEDQQQQ